jgi:predicted SAM-dependent methyltransferase
MAERLKSLLRPLYFYLERTFKTYQFKKHVNQSRRQGQPLKIVIGSCAIYDKGWIPSEEYILDLLNEETWALHFEENEIESLLAEHVWEHLTLEQGSIAAKTCFKFLKRNGYIRVAVPDGNHNDPDYINYVKPGGYGAGADDHKVLYNYKSFSRVFEEAGFEIRLLEYFDENGQFISNLWDEGKGKINRSIRFDDRNINGEPKYTSLIIDAYKS